MGEAFVPEWAGGGLPLGSLKGAQGTITFSLFLAVYRIHSVLHGFIPFFQKFRLIGNAHLLCSLCLSPLGSSVANEPQHVGEAEPGGGGLGSRPAVRLFTTPWTAARQASLPLTVSQSLLKFMSTFKSYLLQSPISGEPLLASVSSAGKMGVIIPTAQRCCKHQVRNRCKSPSV